MKKSIITLALLALATLAAIQFVARSVNRLAPAPNPPAAASIPQASAPNSPTSIHSDRAAVTPISTPRAASSPTNLSASRSFTTEEQIAFTSLLDTLTSPSSTYAERQAAFKQLLASGRIQDAIAELEQRSAANPNDADTLSALGQAYLKACGATDDIRSRATWAMQADRDFESALAINPNNWDARFTRAVAMTFWPANLNQGSTIVDNFNTLIQQQEQQPPQPQFAATYEWLGRQYQTMGQPDLAQQTWQRGAALFPNDQTLRARLATAP